MPPSSRRPNPQSGGSMDKGTLRLQNTSPSTPTGNPPKAIVPPPAPKQKVAATSGANVPSLSAFLTHFGRLEQAAIKAKVKFGDRLQAFRRLWYGGKAGNYLAGGVPEMILGSTSRIPLKAWEAQELSASLEFVRRNQVVGTTRGAVDIGHLFAGEDAERSPDTVKMYRPLPGWGNYQIFTMRSNVEAFNYVGDLGSVVGRYANDHADELRANAGVCVISYPGLDKAFDDYFDAADMAGDADVYATNLVDGQGTLEEQLRRYYTGKESGKRYTKFAQMIGLGSLGGNGKFSGASATWRGALGQQVFIFAVAFSARQKWRTATDAQYIDITRAVVDMFLFRLASLVKAER